ncbi:MAG TPA: SelB C-terminal domain-containing protein, partial [Acidimicrobiia bacterium]|nr:SelB C-terminal domain-containing protein [Acidimicrobiia bacterium]
IALTKIDSVDQDLVELAMAEVSAELEGTSLAGSPIVPVSAVTGEGIDALLSALAGLVEESKDPGDRPRLWIDRAFAIAGAGTVVTGSLLDGRLSTDDMVEIYPRKTSARVRGLQSHERRLESVDPGRRVAVNLGGLDLGEVDRGDMIGLPGQWESGSRFTSTLRHARFVDGIEPRGAYQIHMGTSVATVDIIGMEGEIAVLRIDRPLPMAVGDHFIIRDTGRHLVVGGGLVLDPGPKATRRALGEALHIDPEAERDEIADRLLESRRVDRLSRIEAHARGGRPSRAVVLGDRAVSPELLVELGEKAGRLVDEQHRLHPLRPGLPLATLAERLRVDADLAQRVVEDSAVLERRGPDIARIGHGSSLTSSQENAWAEARNRLAAQLAVPDESELGLDPEVIHLKLRDGELVRVGPGLVYLPEQVRELTSTMASLGDEFTVAQFRDAAGLSRKYAVPILEWADKEGLTVRRGDVRRFR